MLRNNNHTWPHTYALAVIKIGMKKKNPQKRYHNTLKNVAGKKEKEKHRTDKNRTEVLKMCLKEINSNREQEQNKYKRIKNFATEYHNCFRRVLVNFVYI